MSGCGSNGASCPVGRSHSGDVLICAGRSPDARAELGQQALGLLQVGSVKAFSEPAVDRCQQLVGLCALALLLPQPGQTRGRPQLQGLGLLLTGDSEGLLKPRLSLRVAG